MRHLPDFLIVGAAKSGTTSLCHSLSQHNDIFISDPKEPKFLTYKFLKKSYNGPGDDFTLKKAIKKINDYKQLFKNAKPNQIKGEASVDSLYYYDFVIPEIKEKIGDPKIIIMLRNPSQRAFSAYSHLIRDNREVLSFEDGLKKENERLEAGFEFIWAYKKASLYFDSVKSYIENFTNVKVIIFEEFISNKKEGLIDVLNFLERDCSIIDKIQFNRQNVSGKPKNKWLNALLLKDSVLKSFLKMVLPTTKRQNFKQWMIKKNLTPLNKDIDQINKLKEEFINDISKLEQLLNKDISTWKG
ncbi:MAG: sulfotransferase [Flavobacteriaceae bacterium]